MSQQSTLPLPRWVGLFANEVVGAMQLLGIIMGSWDLLGTGNGVYTYQDIQRYPKILDLPMISMIQICCFGRWKDWKAQTSECSRTVVLIL